MLIECEGAPRDLGIDQGRACRDALHDLVARSGLRVHARLPLPRRLAGGSVLGGGAARETLRHYPHLAERMTGIARGAGLPVETIFELMLLATYPRAGEAVCPDGASLAAALAGPADAEATLVRSVTLARVPGRRPVFRRSRPEVGFHSIELTLPWLASALAGVNEHGLAVSFVGAEGIPVTPETFASTAPPNVLLVQECLQRFDALDAALEWCLARPSRGRATLLLADASGQTAAVELSDAERRVLRHDSGTLVAATETSTAACLRKRLDTASPLAAGAVAGMLSATAGELVLEPAAKRIHYRAPSGAVVHYDATT